MALFLKTHHQMCFYSIMKIHLNCTWSREGRNFKMKIRGTQMMCQEYTERTFIGLVKENILMDFLI